VFFHQVLVARQSGATVGRTGIAGRQQPVSGETHRFLAGRFFILRYGYFLARAGESADGFAQQIRLCLVVVSRPAVVEGYREMEKITRLYMRAGQVFPDRLQYGFVPFASDRLLGSQVLTEKGETHEHQHASGWQIAHKDRFGRQMPQKYCLVALSIFNEGSI